MSLLTSLISYFKLDEASGNALDAHGSDALTATNNPSSAAGIINTGRVTSDTGPKYFSHASDAALQAGDIDFTIACWVKFSSLPGHSVLVSKVDLSVSGSREYNLMYNVGLNRIVLEVHKPTDSAVAATADNLGAPSTGVWYYVVGWHDATANTVNIQVNNGTVNSTATGGALQAASTASFGVGARFNSGAAQDFPEATIDEIGYWKRVLTAQERTDLYNAGAGLAYPFSIPLQTFTPGVATISVVATSPEIRYVDTSPRQVYGLQNLFLTFSDTQNFTPGVATIAVSGVDAALAATGTASLVPGFATVTVSGVAPAFTATGSATFTPGAATVTVSGVSPALTPTGTASIVPGAATVTVSGVAPTFTATGAATLTPGTATVTVTGISPALSATGTATIVPGVATVTVSGISPALTPAGSAILTPGFATVTVSGISPALTAAGTVTLTPGFATVTVSGIAPALTPTGQATFTPGAAAVAVSGVAPTFSATGVATFAPGVATVVVSGADVALTGGTAAFIPGVATITVSGVDPLLAASGGVTFTVGVATVGVEAFPVDMTSAPIPSTSEAGSGPRLWIDRFARARQEDEEFAAVAHILS